MILGFAHLALGASDFATAAEDWQARGWRHAATLRDAPSHPAKHPLLSRPARRHDLVLLSGQPPLEVVAHDVGCVDAPSRLSIAEDGIIGLAARDPAVEADFFRSGLGFTGDGGVLQLNSRFPQWCASLSISAVPDAPLDPPLDLCGFTCLAFYCTNPAADGDHLLGVGGRDATAVFDLTLQDRPMSIRMLRSPEGTPIELIRIKAKP